jgi:hypothetical protein
VNSLQLLKCGQLLDTADNCEMLKCDNCDNVTCWKMRHVETADNACNAENANMLTM